MQGYGKNLWRKKKSKIDQARKFSSGNSIATPIRQFYAFDCISYFYELLEGNKIEQVKATIR